MNEFKQVATIDFRVTGGTLQDAYDMMKRYQLYGQAGEDANIIYEGISIPAGYCDTYSDLEAMYDSMLSGDIINFLQSVSSSILPHGLIDQYETERIKIVANELDLNSPQKMAVYKK